MRPRIVLPIVVSLLLLLPLFALAESIEISAVKLRVWLDEVNPPLVLDVRGGEAFRVGTVPGAVNAGRDPMGYLPDDSKEPVVLVVSEEADAKLIDAWGRRLSDAAHEVWILRSGLSGWKAAGGSVEVPEVTYAKPGRVPFVIPRGLCEGNDPAQVFE